TRGRPSSGRKAFGMGAPNRSPRPAASTRAATRMAAQGSGLLERAAGRIYRAVRPAEGGASMRRAIATWRVAGRVAARPRRGARATGSSVRGVRPALAMLLCALLGLVAAGRTAWAQAPPAPAPSAPRAPGALPEVVGGRLRVGLNESVRLAI